MNRDTLIQSPRVLEIALELGFLSADQAAAVLARQKQLRKANVSISTTYTMLERQYLTLEQIRTLNDEMEIRGVTSNASASSCYGAAVTSPPSALKIGKFHTIKVYSESGFTRVYKAIDMVADRVVVLKVLPAALSQLSQWIDRFRREMHLAANIAHPNIVGVYECGSVDNAPYIAFEYLDGVSLAFRLEREGNLPELTAWLLCRELAKGLAYIEEFGILHRDLKPDNVLCGFDGRIKIIDLGLSKSMMDNVAITVTGQTVGTPFYMSPEQAHGTKGLDPRTDIYALGCVTFHMLTGSVPFFAEDAVEVLNKHIHNERPDPRDIIPELSRESTRLAQWMMAIEPEERPATSKQLVKEIDQLIATLPDSAADGRSMLKIVPST